MLWVVAVLGNLVSGCISSLIDSFLGNNRYQSANAQAFFSSMISLVPLPLIFLTGAVALVAPVQLGCFWLLGTLEVVSLNCYVRSVKVEDASVCNSLYGLSRVFTVILAFFLLGEVFSLPTYLGIFLIVLSGFFLCVKENKAVATHPPFTFYSGRLRLSPALWLVGFSSLLDAFASVLTRQMVLEVHWLNALFWTNLGSVVTYLLIFLFFGHFRKEILAEKQLVRFTWRHFLSNEVICLFSAACAFYAYSQAPASIVRALFGLSPLFTILVAWAGQSFFKKAWREDLGHVQLRHKLFWMVLMLVGCYLIVSRV